MNSVILKNRFTLAYSLLRKKDLSVSAPQEVVVEITNRCNLRCPMCIRTHLNGIKIKDLSLEEFCMLIGNITNKTELITLAGLGEPLLNSDIVNMVYEAKRKGFRAALYTNAALLNKELSRDLLTSGLSGIVISFDGATQETYEYYRKGARFEETRRNILDLLQVKNELGSRVFVEIQMIVFENNLSEIKPFLDMWSISGVDSVRIKNDQMCVYKIDNDTQKRVPIVKKICFMPWRGPATVNVHGDVYPCCVGSQYNLILGNIFKRSMEELWDSNSANKLRKDFLAAGAKLSSCKHCHIPLFTLFPFVFGVLLNPLSIYKIYAAIDRISPRTK